MAGLNPSVRGIGQIEESHRGLTYPLYARQLPEQLAMGAWQAVEARAFGEVVGLVIIAQAGPWAEILSLAVAPSFRRQGIGPRLLDAAAVRGRESGATRLSTTFRVDVANAAAVRALLHRNGWSEPVIRTESGRSSSDAVAERAQRSAERIPMPPTVAVVAWGETNAG